MKLLDLLPNRIRMESDILDAPATNIKERRIQYDTFKQWVTKEKRKISSLRNQGVNYTGSNSYCEQDVKSPKEPHHKDADDTKDVEHGSIPPLGRQLRHLVDNTEKSQ